MERVCVRVCGRLERLLLALLFAWPSRSEAQHTAQGSTRLSNKDAKISKEIQRTVQRPCLSLFRAFCCPFLIACSGAAHASARMQKQGQFAARSDINFSEHRSTGHSR